MGKPEDSLSTASESHFGESASAVSLHTTSSFQTPPSSDRFYDEDPTQLADDDLPPLYSDFDPDHDARAVVPVNPLLPSSFQGFDILPYRSHLQSDVAYFVDPRLDSDAKTLHSHIDRLALIPPRPFVKIRGTHSEKRRKEGKKETTTVVDFDIEVELTHLLYSDIHSQTAWRTTRTVGNFEKVHRGTIFATRAPGFGGSGLAEQGEPDIEEWCHRYIASHAGLKRFGLERRVSGWDWDLLRRRLEGMIRATNYRGRTDITFPVRGARVEVYNDCRTNRWRLTKWIEMLFVFTLLFVFSWPWLYFRTKRWETIYIDWQMSRTLATVGGEEREYPAMSEERWYNTWARAFEKAVLERRQGTMDQGDLRKLMTPDAQGRTGGLAGVVQAGVDAMGVVNRSFGWGGDSC